MKAQLFIRGSREPIELEEDEAIAAQNLIADSTKAPDTPFSIEGVWTGKKVDMKYVAFEKKHKERNYHEAVPMREEEAVLFDAELEIYREKAKEYTLLIRASDLWLEKNDAIRIEIYDIFGTKKQTYSVIVRDGQKYKELSEKLASFSLWKSRKEYGARIRDEELDELAKQKSV